jgi:hypothetical protein
LGQLDVTDLCLNEQQYQFICGVTDGRTWEEAAKFAGVKPYNIDFWRRNSRAFQRALEDVHYAHAFQFRRQAIDLADRAFATLAELLDSPKASPTVRLRAAMFIVQTAIDPPKYKPPAPADILELPYDKLTKIRDSWRKQDEKDAEKRRRQAEKRANLPKNAQKPGPRLA